MQSYDNFSNYHTFKAHLQLNVLEARSQLDTINSNTKAPLWTGIGQWCD
jgi:hypothetical protein